MADTNTPEQQTVTISAESLRQLVAFVQTWQAARYFFTLDRPYYVANLVTHPTTMLLIDIATEEAHRALERL